MKSRALYATISIAALSVGLAAPALAQQSAADSGFDLGRITVHGQHAPGIEISGSTLSAEAMRTFNRNSLDEAVDMMPGVVASTSGGSRNEREIFVRGFERWQVPLSIDGIRVYLPADNRLDYARFLTSDIAEVQVSKGYASVLDGPGAMGGAINLVTRTPTRELEAEARVSFNFDNDEDYAGQTVFALAGTRQGNFYAQASYAQTYVDHWNLSSDYVPVTRSAELGGERDFSKSRDERINVKVGFTPNATDEYSLSYTRQQGSKNAPLHVTNLGNQRNWSWPQWDIDSIYFLSRTAIGDSVTLKTRAYYNTFDNLLSAWDDASQTTQSRPRAFNSYYDDEAWGGSAQIDYQLNDRNAFSIAGHYRADKHVETQESFPGGVFEPEHGNREDVFSIAAEYRSALTPDLNFTAGVSYDWRDLKEATEYNVPPGQPANAPRAVFSYPLENADAWNGQARLDWTPDADTAVWGSVSSRARFPTVFERFSSQFGGATSNPSLKGERATTFEIGASRQYGVIRAEGSVFYSKLYDAIVSVPMLFENCVGGVCTLEPVDQRRNVGDGDMLGFELMLEAELSDALTLGGNYTFIDADIYDPTIPARPFVQVPEHKAFLYAQWTPVAGLRITPNIDIASDRWTESFTGGTWYETGSYVLANLSVEYDLTDQVSVSAGARNLFDKNYVLTDGFPQAGRSLFLTLRAAY